jgi:hypothetical protein
MSDCEKCGRDNGHWLGCEATQVTDLGLHHAGPASADECGRDGCTNGRAVSKGPRPAKYCETHKTGSKK